MDSPTKLPPAQLVVRDPESHIVGGVLLDEQIEICGLSFVFALNKENESKWDIRTSRPMDINSDF